MLALTAATAAMAASINARYAETPALYSVSIRASGAGVGRSRTVMLAFNLVNAESIHDILVVMIVWFSDADEDKVPPRLEISLKLLYSETALWRTGVLATDAAGNRLCR